MRHVTELFDVHLRITTGAKSVFIVSGDEIKSANVSRSELSYFRPVADDICNGQIITRSFLFYPYDAAGLRLTSEEAVRKAVPWFYREKLHPNFSRLSSERKSTRKRNWWELVEPRPTWMNGNAPRLLCPAFGQCGSFAFDGAARYAIVQGNSLFWSGDNGSQDLLLAYLAIFNSYEFESLLELLCPRVRGGQYELYRKDLARVPLPDLRIADATIRQQLIREGSRIATNDVFSPARISAPVSHLYGLAPSEFRKSFSPGKRRALHERFCAIGEGMETRHVASF